jgi:hypothetical protein
MVVVIDNPHVRDLFALTAIDLTLPVFTNLDQAIEWLGAGTSEAVPPQWWIAASTTGTVTRLPHPMSPARGWVGLRSGRTSPITARRSTSRLITVSS